MKNSVRCLRGVAVVVVLVLTSVVVMSAITSDLTETWFEYQARVNKYTDKKRMKSALEMNPELAVLHARQKRTVAFPTGSTLVLTPILCIPVFSMGDISGVLDLELPFIIKLPNTSNFDIIGRSDERLGIYSLVEESIDKIGLSGKACLLRAMCEVAETPLRDDGLLGEVLNIILSVSMDFPTTLETPLDEMTEYMKAEYRGKHYGDCWSAYPECPVSVFGLFDT